MAEAMGINTFRYKVSIFLIAALLASIGGWLLAHFQLTVNPSAFGLKMGIEYLFMTVVGGIGYVWGAIVGAGLIKLLDDYLQVALPALIGTSGSYEVIVFGVAIVLVLKYLPDGLWSLVARYLPSTPRAGRLAGCREPAQPRQASQRRVGAEGGEDPQAVRRADRRERHQLSDRCRADRGTDRTQRRGQVHHLQPDHRRPCPRRAGRCCSGVRTSAPCPHAASRARAWRAPSSTSR